MLTVRHFRVRAQVYDRKAAQMEMDEKVLIDPTLAGKSREEMGLEPFTCTEIRSSIMGIPVFISQEVIAYVIRRLSEGSFKDGLDNNKNSPWNEVVNKTMFNSKKKGAYSDLSMDKKLLMKIQNENLLPKGGGGDQPSLEHKVFLHYFITKEKANVPKYIFRYMIKTLRESQTIKRCWIPYGILISEILHQGGILSALSKTKIFTDKDLGTVTGKVINGSTLRHIKLISKKDYKKLDTDLKESDVVSNLMENFPPICLKDPMDVRVSYILKNYETTGETIRMENVPENMYGGALPMASKKKRKLTKKEYLSEVDDDDEASEPQKKKVKKAKIDHVAPKEKATNSGVPSLQEEVQDLDADKVLNKRTRSGKTVGSSQSQLQPGQSIPKKKRKHVVRKLKVVDYVMEDEEQIGAATDLVTREIKKKKAAEEALIDVWQVYEKLSKY
jgi:hypothetical protein